MSELKSLKSDKEYIDFSKWHKYYEDESTIQPFISMETVNNVVNFKNYDDLIDAASTRIYLPIMICLEDVTSSFQAFYFEEYILNCTIPNVLKRIIANYIWFGPWTMCLFAAFSQKSTNRNDITGQLSTTYLYIYKYTDEAQIKDVVNLYCKTISKKYKIQCFRKDKYLYNLKNKLENLEIVPINGYFTASSMISRIDKKCVVEYFNKLSKMPLNYIHIRKSVEIQTCCGKGCFDFCFESTPYFIGGYKANDDEYKAWVDKFYPEYSKFCNSKDADFVEASIFRRENVRQILEIANAIYRLLQ